MVKIGLISKLKSFGGKVKNVAASSLGAVKTRASGMIAKNPTLNKIASNPISKKVVSVAAPAAKLAVKVGKFGLGMTPIGRTAKIALGAAALGTVGVAALKKRAANKRAKVNANTYAETMREQAKIDAYEEPQGKKGGTLASKIVKAVAIGGGVAAAAYGAEKLAEKLGVRGGAGFFGRRKRRKSKRKKSYRKSYRRKSKRRSGRGSKKIYRTRTGQPYIKLASGKARFISKRSAKTMRKRKGGYQ